MTEQTPYFSDTELLDAIEGFLISYRQAGGSSSMRITARENRYGEISFSVSGAKRSRSLREALLNLPAIGIVAEDARP